MIHSTGMIRYYIVLELRIIKRHLNEWGIKPLIAFPLFALSFVVLSFFLFYKIELAGEVYSILALSVVTGLGSSKRKEFMTSFLSKADYHKIRMIENILGVLPFTVILLLKNEWLYAVSIGIISIMMSGMNLVIPSGKSIPTPFSCSPFEFPVGFRRTFPLILLAYALAVIGLRVDNFNLAAFSLGLIFFIAFSYYSFLEKPEYIWIHSQKPKLFLFQKIKTALMNCLLLCIPTILLIFIFRFDQIGTVVLLIAVGNLFLVAVLLSKYTAYPREMNIPNGILMGLALLFPPLLLALIPFFYNQSVSSLKKVLK